MLLPVAQNKFHFVLMYDNLWFNPVQNIVLIFLQQAEETRDPEKAAEFSQQAKKFGIISIVIWVSILALTPILMALISYLLTLQD